jgi:hypothetical protein
MNIRNGKNNDFTVRPKGYELSLNERITISSGQAFNYSLDMLKTIP